MILLEDPTALRSIVKTAHIHAKRLQYALDKLAAFFPMTAATVIALSEEGLPLFELLTSRFAKWQDLKGLNRAMAFAERQGVL